MRRNLVEARFVAPVFNLAFTKITMSERTYQEELSKMIEQVEHVHFELLEMRSAYGRAGGGRGEAAALLGVSKNVLRVQDQD